MNQAYHCGVQCIVLRRRKVLLGKRFRTSCEGQWALPGGHVEFFESPMDAARRELREETSLIGGEAVAGGSFTTYTTDLPYVHVPVLFRQAAGVPVVPADEKFSDLRFFSLADLPQPIFAPSIRALELVGSGFVEQDLAVRDSSYLKMDFIETTGLVETNRGYSALLVRDRRGSWLIRSWGRRDIPGWRTAREEVADVAAGLSRINSIVHEKI